MGQTTNPGLAKTPTLVGVTGKAQAGGANLGRASAADDATLRAAADPAHGARPAGLSTAHAANRSRAMALRAAGLP
ncbi:MAG: hypothetical protein AAFY27_12265, partial [Pseudomonadota bacterium]